MVSDPRALRFDASFSDGKSAVSHSVEVRFTATGLEIAGADAGQPIKWPYSSLQSAVPLERVTDSVSLTVRDNEGATLYLTSPEFIGTLKEQAPHLTTSAQRWRHVRPLIVTTIAMIAVVVAVYAFKLTPAKTIAGWIPDSARDLMGQQVVTAMTGRRKVCKAPEGLAALAELTARLTEASGSEGQFEVRVVEWDLVNAFAAPGETILLTSGLIKAAASGDEVAGVLAHEMGHGLERHPETALVRSLGLTALAQVFLGGGNLPGIGIALTQFAYTREAEREADQRALDLLRAAGVSPRGLAAFFRRTQAKRRRGKEGKNHDAKSGSGSSDKLTEPEHTTADEKVETSESKSPDGGRSSGGLDLFQTHPSIEERIRAVDAVPDYPSTPSMSTSDWTALQNICKDSPATEKPKSKP